MHYLAPLLFVVLCAVGLSRPMWALVLLLVMFSLEVALQSTFSIFRTSGSLTNITVAIVVGFATLRALSRQQRPMLGHATPALTIVCIIMGWSILSLLWTPAVSTAANQGTNLISEGYPYFIVFVLIAPLLVDSMADWRRATALMLVIGSMVALSIVLNPEFTVRSGRIGISLGASDRTSPLSLAQMGGMLAIFGALSAGGRASGLQTTVRVGAFICGALLALFSGTRGQAVFALIIIAMMLPLSRRLKNLGSYLSILAVGAVVAIGAYVIFGFVLERSDADRWQLGSIASATAVRQWNVAELLEAFVSSPPAWIIGLGFNAFSAVTGAGAQGYVHNVFAEVLCELGLPMFVLLILLYIRTGVAARSLFVRYREHPAERSAVAILIAMWIFQSLIGAKESTLWSSYLLFLFMLLIIRLDIRAQEFGDDFEEDEPVMDSLPEPSEASVDVDPAELERRA